MRLQFEIDMRRMHVLLPRRQGKLARGAKHTPNTAIVAIGIDQELVQCRGPRWARRHRAAAKVVAWPVEARLANIPPCLIGMEAWVGAHHLKCCQQAIGKQFQSESHAPKVRSASRN
jgi:hypothetical protein